MKVENIKIGRRKIANFVLVVSIILLVNLLSGNLFFRLDLTKEKRYTISNDTKQILKNLEDNVFVRVYLDGELNIPFKNFQKSIIEILDEFKVYAKSNLEYEIIDPFEGLSDKDINKVLVELNNKGLNPTNIFQSKKGQRSEKLIIPGAMVVYNGIEIPVNLLVNLTGKRGEQNINTSVENLEYNFIQTIKNITAREVEKIAFIEGHKEWPTLFIEDIMKDLSKSFQIDRGAINGQANILDAYKAVIIAGPIAEFKENDKYVIDQYIMQGGKVLWLIDAVNVNLDSLNMGRVLAYPNQLNLEDMLFRYGVRINTNLIQDAQSGIKIINVALAGEPPRFMPHPWIYNPLITPSDGNNITTNLNKVLLQFASSIDTIEARSNIRKTPLLISSKNSKTVDIPRMIELQEANTPVSKIEFNNPERLIGVLLEGKFESVFRNRMLDEYFEDLPANKLDKSVETKMVVIADADIIRNEVRQTKSGYASLPLGFDRNDEQTYANKKFLVNTINYLTGNANLINLRGREFKLRLLDQSKIEKDRIKWQLLNILLPVVIVLFSAIIYGYFRKRKYVKKN